MRAGLCFLATVLGTATVHAADIHPDAYTQSVVQWRADRVTKLTAPDGWLSLVGLAWLQPGANTIGSAADNTIALTGGPAHVGVLTLSADGTARLAVQAGAGVLIDGKALPEATLVDDVQAGAGEPTLVSIGTTSFYVIDREGRKGLRIKDPQAPSRTGFLGIDYFPIDPTWQVQGDWEAAVAGETLEMGTVIGTTETYPVPGKVRFTRDGKTFEILPVLEVPGDKQFFVVFADRTSGKETYGAARFLYIDPPHDGKVVLDFNRAYNPPCAFTAFATCPLAPPENRLDLRVTAGEKKYRGEHD
ncbi:MAG: DUF1684 domain-containing protein [Rhodanobacter sp.]